MKNLPVLDSRDTAPLDLTRYAEGPGEECGVFGIYAPGEDVARLTYFALYALQHRGQESAGIAASDGQRITVHKDMGLVNQVFTDTSLAALDGVAAVGHCRYSTTGASSWVNAQPQYRERAGGGGLALGHNGNLVNTLQLAAEEGVSAANDSELMAEILARDPEHDMADVIFRHAPRFVGGASVVVMEGERIHAFRDRQGVRPLQIGRLANGGWCVASESAALDIVGATLVRDVQPGEVVSIDKSGLSSRTFATPKPAFCLFEWVYLARPDHRQDGASVMSVRRELGRRLAREAPVDADVVIPVPEAGRDAAAGYAAESGIEFADGLVKNRYVGRTFIQPTQTLRQLGIRLKLSPVREMVENRRLVVVDDSIVRGNTSRQLVTMLRSVGAKEVHLRITAPPITDPCYYGIDMASPAELIGADLTVDEICTYLGADSLHYISLDALVGASPSTREQLCTACFTGDYPIPIPPEQEQLNQARFEFGELPRA